MISLKVRELVVSIQCFAGTVYVADGKTMSFKPMERQHTTHANSDDARSQPFSKLKSSSGHAGQYTRRFPVGLLGSKESIPCPCPNQTLVLRYDQKRAMNRNWL